MPNDHEYWQRCEHSPFLHGAYYYLVMAIANAILQAAFLTTDSPKIVQNHVCNLQCRSKDVLLACTLRIYMVYYSYKPLKVPPILSPTTDPKRVLINVDTNVHYRPFMLMHRMTPSSQPIFPIPTNQNPFRPMDHEDTRQVSDKRNI